MLRPASKCWDSTNPVAPVPPMATFTQSRRKVSARGMGTIYIGYLIILDGLNIKEIGLGNTIAFGKSTSHRIYPKQHTPKIRYYLINCGLKHALHILDGHLG